jgi:polyvinyl alcohol dehydrogenase (cytochrome)
MVVASVPGVASPAVQTARAAAKPPSVGAPQTATSTAVTPNGSWTMYHRDHAHTGYDSTQQAVTSVAAGWVSPTLDGDVYGEPLVYNGLVYVATLNNSVYALNQSDGTIVWSVHLGAPQTSGWGCGNINPTGILGTGVIDPSSSRIYVVAFLHQYLSYFLFGLDLATGNQRLLTQVSPNAFDWTIQQQRGALTLSHDNTHVYVPFGGRDGDCGAYHGWVVGVPQNGNAPDELYETPSTASGIWAAGGTVVDDSTGNVLFATGNAIPCNAAINSDSVIRTAATLGAATSFFQPQDWLNNWCVPDLDLGSTTPVLINSGLMFATGKYGQGFLVNPQSLGGTDGQLFPTPAPATYVGADVCRGDHSSVVFGSIAYAAPYVYFSCNGHGLVALQVNTSTPSFSPCGATCSSPSWNAGGGTTFGPPIVAGGVVWVVDTGGASGLYGFNAATGAQVYHSSGFGVVHFSTPTEAGSEIFVGAGTEVRSFALNKCTSASLSPTSATQPAGSTVNFTASSTGCTAPRYAFWVQYPDTSWHLVQGFGGPAFNWDTTGLGPGSYTVHVWVNQQGNGYDAIGSASVTLTGCGGASLSPPSSTQPGGATVTLTASSSGCGTPRYAFWVQYPDTSWHFLQDFGGPTFNWNTGALPAGTYTVHAWLNTQGNGYDAIGSATVTLTGCGSAALSPPTTSVQLGTTINYTASSSGCVNPRYGFWVQYPDMSWHFVQNFGGPAFNWSTTGLTPGSYTVHVWVNRAGNSYETVGSATATLTGCATSSLNPSSGTAARGSTIPFTASSTGCSSPRYAFWVQYPDSTWHFDQNFGGTTFNWNTAGLAAGSYTIHVWVNTQGNGYDAIGAATYTLT